MKKRVDTDAFFRYRNLRLQHYESVYRDGDKNAFYEISFFVKIDVVKVSFRRVGGHFESDYRLNRSVHVFVDGVFVLVAVPEHDVVGNGTLSVDGFYRTDFALFFYDKRLSLGYARGSGLFLSVKKDLTYESVFFQLVQHYSARHRGQFKRGVRRSEQRRVAA